MKTAEPEHLLTTEEAARFCRMHSSRIRAAVASGRLKPTFRLGPRSWRWEKADLLRQLAEWSDSATS